MKLALHRSITFWSGLLVMGFVCWAWWTSRISCSGWLHHPDGHTRRGIVNCDSELRLFHLQSKNELTTKPSFLGDTFHQRRNYKGFESESWDGRSPYHAVQMPHWLILLTVAAVWLVLLFWRARRRKCIITP